MEGVEGVSRVVWGQQCLEVSAFVQILSSVKNGGRPEAPRIISAPAKQANIRAEGNL